MSNINLIIEERSADIGNFTVGRLLPFRQKRSVGPFVFFDHMGPALLSADQNLDVLPHPHIGLSTLTYLFDGAITHRDSMGFEMDILPGAVNWMTAGKGVVHSERTPLSQRKETKSLHGIQIWVALPRELEESEPSFDHIEAGDIPAWRNQGVEMKLIAGEALGKKSPVPVHSKLFLIEMKSSAPAKISLNQELYGETALYILEGALHIYGRDYEPKRLLFASDSKPIECEMAANTSIYVLGGEPFPEPRYIDWNFVSSSKERLKQAREDWIGQKFQMVNGETGFVPYPGHKE